MIKPTDTIFVIHNFNMVPNDLLKYCENYVLYDASTEPGITDRLEEEGIKYTKIQNTGHNLTTYFNYFADHYDSLPEFMCLLKGNILGRHCSAEFFQRVYTNKYFTYLYEDKNVILKHDIISLLWRICIWRKMIPGMLDRQIIHTDILIISTDCCNLYTKMRLFQNIVYLRRGAVILYPENRY